MKGRIGGVYKVLQGLELKPTPENARIMTAVYNTLEEIYTEMDGKETDSGEEMAIREEDL